MPKIRVTFPEVAKSLTQELVKARDAIVRQLEILRSPVSYGRGNVSFPPDNQALIAKLEEQLAEISAALARAKDSDRADP